MADTPVPDPGAASRGGGGGEGDGGEAGARVSALDPMAKVRASAEFIAASSDHVRIDNDAVQRYAKALIEGGTGGDGVLTPPAWDHDCHYCDGTDLTAQYVFVLDCLNFCFWPDPSWEYHPLSRGLKKVLEGNPHAFDGEALAVLTVDEFRGWFDGKAMPLEDERVRMLREAGAVLVKHFDGQVAELVRRCGGSARDLVAMVTMYFPGFRDASVYGGRQVFFYKRAQIFVGDLWGSFGGAGLGAFDDIESVTMFADYRVPQILVHLGVLVYTDALAAKIAAEEVIPAGSNEELEIRGNTVHAVELICAALAELTAESGSARPWHSLEIDWHLWEEGEALDAAKSIPPPHHTLTVFY